MDRDMEAVFPAPSSCLDNQYCIQRTPEKGKPMHITPPPPAPPRKLPAGLIPISSREPLEGYHGGIHPMVDQDKSDYSTDGKGTAWVTESAINQAQWTNAHDFVRSMETEQKPEKQFIGTMTNALGET